MSDENIDFKGHLCLSFNGNDCPIGGDAGGGNGSDKALNFALLVPEGTTWDNFSRDLVVTPSLPNPVAVNKAYTLPSPFGRRPCMAVAYVKNPHTAQWQEVTPCLYYTSKGLSKTGLKVSCPGDGNVYLATGTHYLAVAASNSQGQLAPAAQADSGNFTSAEIVIALWCATGDALTALPAFQALEARIAALEAANA